MAFKWLKRKKDKHETEPSEAPADQAPDASDRPAEAIASQLPDSRPEDAAAEREAESPPLESATFPAIEAAAVDKEASAADVADEPMATAEPAEAEKPRRGFIKRLRSGLSKTRDFLNTDIEDLFSGKRKFDEEMLEELEEMLITADIGVRTTTALIDQISRNASKIDSVENLKAILREEILKLIDEAPQEHTGVAAGGPRVVMVVGVNGVGKTTTIGKIAAHHTRKGRKVLIAAADTFRAAAIEQLTIWAARAGADIVKHKDQADPAAVAYDAVEAAMAREADVVLIDTAGRLHTKVNLMEELKKIKRSVGKKIAAAPHETLLVLDATTGQNALSQAQLFDEAIELDALALTKLDGTAKGGIVVSICSTLKVPLRYIGVGEQIDDLQTFDAKDFVEALF
jgi:fused signal recognition particle receptor